MGRIAKAKRHATKMRARRAAKAARKAAYAGMRGTSKKSKKLLRTRARRLVSSFKHLIAHCGNVGCRRCFPQFVRVIRNGQVMPAVKP